ncbi:hypothetical protein M9Y10_018151 [Tritrichomonas musculus]|uniref:N-acetyltransferase domain-containing protein n=1 Tax=Tritrichomonas musculus TaxID=1915356 RepID=A0ABR2HMW0_9EUKA
MSLTVYDNGQDFLNDNYAILQKNPIETNFFKLNAKNMHDMSNGFVCKLTEDNRFVLALGFKKYPMLIFGDNSLLRSLALNLTQQNFTFDRILAPAETAKSFINCFEQIYGGDHEIVHSMDIMMCTKLIKNDTNTSSVEYAKQSDVQEIANIIYQFNLNVHQHSEPISTFVDDVKNRINNFVLIRLDNKIVSIAQKTREDENLCSISSVYTREDYRCRGLSRKIMTFLTNQIIESGKIAYLFVDKTNPISNHLYTSIGYSYISPQMEIRYFPRK